jgi:hypothetical protein
MLYFCFQVPYLFVFVSVFLPFQGKMSFVYWIPLDVESLLGSKFFGKGGEGLGTLRNFNVSIVFF